MINAICKENIGLALSLEFCSRIYEHYMSYLDVLRYLTKINYLILSNEESFPPYFLLRAKLVTIQIQIANYVYLTALNNQ